MNVEIRSSTAAVPEVFKEVRIEPNGQRKSQVGHVAKFHSDDENLSNDEELYPRPTDPVYHIGTKTKVSSTKVNQFLTLNKEDLKSFMRDRSWRRLRWIFALSYLLSMVILLFAAILLVVGSQRCSSKRSLTWIDKDIIYEVDLQMFSDSNGDGQGDLQGLIDKIDYLQRYSLKTLLLRSTIFASPPYEDLYQFSPQISPSNHFQSLKKLLRRKDMHLILDLPLSSTSHPNGTSWYGQQQSLHPPIASPCEEQRKDPLACEYYLAYGRLPLDFHHSFVREQAQNRIDHWLLKENVDGLRLDLPLEKNQQTNLYQMSIQTMQQWKEILQQTNNRGQTKLIFYDIPSNLHRFINDSAIRPKASYFILDQQQQQPDADHPFHNRTQLFTLHPSNTHRFVQLRSNRMNEPTKSNLSEGFLLTMAMLSGGTPVILYGEEFGLRQKGNRLMLWTPDEPSGGFSSCQTQSCLRLFTLYEINPRQNNVKRAEAIDGNSRDSLLRLFQSLSQFRQLNSFRSGSMDWAIDEQSKIFWLRRRLMGDRHYLVVFNWNEQELPNIHLSLYRMTSRSIPLHIQCEYQWPTRSFHEKRIDSDNLFLQSNSISIFSWDEPRSASTFSFIKSSSS